jgi:hypothetical protein
VLGKCANPACDAKFQYLHVGKLFAVEYPYSQPNGAIPGSKFVSRRDRLRYFWLCPICSQTLTIQASRDGGVRIAPTHGRIPDNEVQGVMSDSNALMGCNMLTAKRRLGALVRELEFLDNDGYRSALGWRPPLIFEDSPICPKMSSSPCPTTNCLLMNFVPEECRKQPAACRHIPLKENGESLESLYKRGSDEEIEQALREWLLNTIAEIEDLSQFESSRREKIGRTSEELSRLTRLGKPTHALGVQIV